MKHTYTIIWSMRDSENELTSWIGRSYQTEEEANNIASKTAHLIWDKIPSLSWMILKHLYSWKTEFGENEEPF